MLVVALLSGCSESSFSYAEGVEVCGSAYWPEEDAPPIDDDPRWTLEKRWSTSLGGGGFVRAMYGAPFVDTDGDGEIGTGDRIDVVVSSRDDLEWLVWYIDGATGEPTRVVAYDWRVTLVLTVAEVDPSHAGPEIVILTDEAVSLAGPEGIYLTSEVPELDAGNGALVTDLEGDGSLEIVAGNGVYSFDTGIRRFGLDPFRGLWVYPQVADLDGDGEQEIVVAGYDGQVARLVDPRGRVLTELTGGSGGGDPSWNFAIGNLDLDPELEVVGTSDTGTWVWNHDGSIAAHAEKVGVHYGTIGIGELDGDPTPEIVLDIQGVMFAYDADLTPMDLAGDNRILGWGSGFSLADLDGDGLHEVVSGAGGYLAVTRSDGTQLALYPYAASTEGWSGVRSGPMLVDVDGDGLAEIVTHDPAHDRIVALDNAAGGWPVLGADHPWFDFDHHPDRMAPDGTPGRIDPASVAAGHNVWNAREAAPPECSAVLDLEVRDVCVEGCEGDTILTVYVTNRGMIPTSSAVSLALVVDGQVRAEVPMPEVPAGRGVPVSMEVATAGLIGADRVEVRLTGPTDVGCEVPTASWEQPVCPER